jgi:uncharacterized NAD(P)/FAD-binding protein YdhS
MSLSAPSHRRVAVIGAGVSGALTAVHLTRLAPADVRVTLYERADRQGRGIAYETREPGHLLNVRAANMSAFADVPHHFEAWLDEHPRISAEVQHTASGDFVSREVYGRYLEDILRNACLDESGGCIGLRQADVRQVERAECGFIVTDGEGRRDRFDDVVLAMGNVSDAADEAGPVFRNPWTPQAVRDLDPDRPVLILGTGLTTIDTVIALRRRGFPGHILAMSRRGLLPHPHAVAKAVAQPVLCDKEKTHLSHLVRRLRQEVHGAGADWRAVVDAMRPVTQALWQGLGPVAQARFLRHARPFWDIHRHRIAQPVARAIADEIRGGGLTILRGRVQSVQREIAGTGVSVAYRPRGGGTQRALSVQRLIVATGVPELSRSRDSLVKNLITDGLARLDPLGLGLDADRALGVRNAEGLREPGLWALGPVVRGVFWECTAVPDIRVQAAELARTILKPQPVRLVAAR